MARNTKDHSELVPSGMEFTVKGGHAQLKLIPQNFPSVDDLFAQGSNPERIISYPRYDGEPDVACPGCNAKVKLSRIPFQNGCKDCKDMGLNMCACICSLCL